MTTPDADRLDELDDEIESARRQAEEHGSIEGEHEPRFVEPDEEERGDGVPQGLVP